MQNPWRTDRSLSAPPVLSTPAPEVCPDPLHWAATRLRFSPDPLQAQILRSPAHRLLLNCPRQWGKTTIAAVKALHFALHHPRTTTLVAAPTQRQSSLFLQKIAACLPTLHLPSRPVPGFERSLLLPNRSQILSLPGWARSVPGHSAHLLILDEAACIPAPLFDALLPSLASTNGPLWLLSTPNGLQNIFYRFWTDARTPWARFTSPAPQCPRFTGEFLAAQRLLLGEHAYREQYLCEFLQHPEAFFPLDLINAAIDPAFESLFRNGPLP